MQLRFIEKIVHSTKTHVFWKKTNENRFESQKNPKFVDFFTKKYAEFRFFSQLFVLSTRITRESQRSFHSHTQT